jgi:protein involved in polysaccharide export with SLBB domain
MSMIKFSRGLRLWAAVGGLLVLGSLVVGCHSAPKRDYTDKPGAASAPPSIPGSEVFHEGQAVTVVFSDLPTLPQAYDVKIREDGTVTLLLNQPFTFAGKTRGSLEKEIRERYVPRYYKYMTVNIKWESQTLFYYVDGEVKTPTRQSYIERTTVLKAIASAGGFTDFAKKSGVKLVRLDGRKYTVNCVKAREDPNLDLEVFPGDKIFVPRKLF